MKNINKITTTAVLSAVALSVFSAYAFEPITSQLDPGSRGVNVTRLQTFVAANPNIYPEGLVTGYYGPLTKASVIRFQSTYGIDQAGRVGPITLAKINNLIANGGWNNTVSDMLAPLFYTISNNLSSNNNFTVNFVTNENTSARMVYSTSPIMFNDGDTNGTWFAIRSGSIVSDNNSTLGTNHSITLQNLSANTTYYYTLVATDAAGNVSVWGINNTFKTNN